MPTKQEISRLTPLQRKFYHELYSHNFKLPQERFGKKDTTVLQDALFYKPIRECPPAIAREIAKRNSEPPILLHAIISQWMLAIQATMLGQPPEIQRKIIEIQVALLLPNLKKVYEYQYNKPEDKEENLNFWGFITNAIIESIEESFDPETLREYFTNYLVWTLYFYDSPPNKYFNQLQVNMERGLNGVVDEKRREVISCAECEFGKICENVRARYQKIIYTPAYTNSRSVGIIGLGALLAVPPLLYGVPVLSLLIAGSGVVFGLGSHVIDRHSLKRHPQFITPVATMLIKRGEKLMFDLYGIKKDLRIANDKEWGSFFINSAVNQLLAEIIAGRNFIKVVGASNKGEVKEIYVPGDQFPQLIGGGSSGTPYKIGPVPKSKKPLSSFTTILESTTRKPEPPRKRNIVLPLDFQGEIVEAKNRQLMIVKPFPASSQVDPQDIQEVKLPRGLVMARARGQSGFKWNSKGRLCLKDKNSGKRVNYTKAGTELIEVDGKPQTVPVYVPIRTYCK